MIYDDFDCPIGVVDGSNNLVDLTGDTEKGADRDTRVADQKDVTATTVSSSAAAASSTKGSYVSTAEAADSSAILAATKDSAPTSNATVFCAAASSATAHTTVDTFTATPKSAAVTPMTTAPEWERSVVTGVDGNLVVTSSNMGGAVVDHLGSPAEFVGYGPRATNRRETLDTATRHVRECIQATCCEGHLHNAICAVRAD